MLIRHIYPHLNTNNNDLIRRKIFDEQKKKTSRDRKEAQGTAHLRTGREVHLPHAAYRGRSYIPCALPEAQGIQQGGSRAGRPQHEGDFLAEYGNKDI